MRTQSASLEAETADAKAETVLPSTCDVGAEKVLVLCATGKAGSGISCALKDANFDVYGTTRKNADVLRRRGIKPIVANYTIRADLDRAFAESGAKRVVVITDFFKAAARCVACEIEQGRAAFDAAQAAGVEHLVFMSAIDADKFPPECTHVKAKLSLERLLRSGATGVPFSIVRPCAFFENWDDASSFNPLKKGQLCFLSTASLPYCATYDIGRAAAVQFRQPCEWMGKTLDVIGWKGELKEAAAALEKVSGTPVKYGLVMPLWARRFFLPDLHAMCLYYEADKVKGTPEDFKDVVPEALSAGEWFRRKGTFANGEPIVPPSSSAADAEQPRRRFPDIAAFAAPALGIVVLASAVSLGARHAGMR